jgi:hypothetical protein
MRVSRVARADAGESGRDGASHAHPPGGARPERPSRQPQVVLRLQRAAGNRTVAALLGRPGMVVQRADDDIAATLQAQAQARIEAAKATGAAGAGQGRQAGEDGSPPADNGEQPAQPSPEQVAAETARQKKQVAGTVTPPDTSGAKLDASSTAAAAKEEAAKPPASGGGATASSAAPQAAPADGAADSGATEVTAAVQQATQATAAATAEVAPAEPDPVAPYEPLQVMNAGGREIPADPAMEAGIETISARLQALRAGAYQVQATASAERAQGHQLEGLLHAARGAVADAAAGVDGLKAHNDHRRSVVQQAKDALNVSGQKAETVASGAPGLSAQSDEGAQKSGPMASGSKDLAAENASKTPEDGEAAGKSAEQGSQLTKVATDMASIDDTIGQTKSRAEQLAGEAVQAKQSNAQAQGEIGATEQAISQAEAKADELSGQNEAAKAQLEGFAAEPAAHRAAADEIDAQGLEMHTASVQLEARLAAAQQSHLDAVAATPPPVPARRGRPVQRDAYAGRTTYEPDAAVAGALPSWVTGEDPPSAAAAAAHKAQEDDRHAAEIAEISQQADGHFERLTASQKAGLALQLTGHNLLKGIGGVNLPQFGLTILRGFVDPRVSLMGIVHGLGSIASGVANLFSAEQWEKDPLGNALKSAADIATGVTIVLGSIAGLAVAIGIILTVIAIVGSIFSFGAVGAALAPIIIFCGTVASTVGPWAIWAAGVALVLHSLVFIKNLIDAATAQTAGQLEQSSEQMTQDAQNAGSMAMQIGMAKAMEAGGRLLSGPGGGAGEAGAAPSADAGTPPAELSPADTPSTPGQDTAPATPPASELSPVDLGGTPANDNAVPRPEAAEQVLAATGTDGPVDVGTAGPQLHVIEGGGGDAPRAMAGDGPTGGGSGSEPPSTTSGPGQAGPGVQEGPGGQGGPGGPTGGGPEPKATGEPPATSSGPEFSLEDLPEREPANDVEPETLADQVRAEFEGYQEQAEGGGDVRSDYEANADNVRPQFEPPSASSKTVTGDSPQAQSDPIYQALMDHVTAAQEKFNEEGFTQAETDAIERAPTQAAKDSARARFYGERIDTFVKQSMQDDPRLHGIGVSEIRQPGPDFFDPSTDTWYDITTAKSWPRHVQKYGYGGQGVLLPSGR